MKISLIAVSLALLVSVTVADDPAWNDFRGTFQILKEDAFAQFPKTNREQLFIDEKWGPVSSTADDCTNGGLFNGIQYVRNGSDYSVGLLYDKNGHIAGLQMIIPKFVVLTPENHVNYGAIPMYNNVTYNGEDYFIVTTYFIEPSIICTTGRSEEELATGGTGTGLWIQNGPTPTDILQVPMNRPEGDDAVTSKWTENNCFPAMGYHNFRDVPKYQETNCVEMAPIFALYNRQKVLHGFGLITPGTINNPRFEHPPPTAIKLILGKEQTPQCVLALQESIGITSLHVYFTQRPWFITCPVFQTIGSAFSGYVTSAARWLRSLG